MSKDAFYIMSANNVQSYKDSHRFEQPWFWVLGASPNVPIEID